MKNPKVQFVILAVLVIAAGLLIPSLTQAKPKDLPGQDTEPHRDGYSRSFVVDANSVLFTVPEGRCYVLTRLYVRTIDSQPPSWWDVMNPSLYERQTSFWTLTIDDALFLDELALALPYLYSPEVGATMMIDGDFKEDFPDAQVVVHGGQTLGMTKHQAIDKVCLTLIGYFCDAP